MNTEYTEAVALASALLRGITDELAAGRRPLTGQESIPQLIERVEQTSAQCRQQMQWALATACPGIGWNDSEDKRGGEAGTAPYWVYDPIDGAYHYLQGLPLWASSLALMQGGRAIAALVYEPVQRELFVAIAGQGTTLNGEPVTVSAKSDLRCAVVGTALPPFAAGTPQAHEDAVKVQVETAKRVFVVRQMAAASLQLAYVSAGRLDAYVETGTDVYDWMAGALLVEEAGGKVGSLTGNAFDIEAQGVLASTPALRDALLDIARGASAGTGSVLQ